MMGNLDKIIMEAGKLLPLDQFINQFGQNHVNEKGTWIENPLCDKSRELNTLVDVIFKENLSPIYLENSAIKNLHLGLIHTERQEFNEAFDCFKRVYEIDKDSLYTYAFFSFLASHLRNHYLLDELIKKRKKERITPEFLAKSKDLYKKFESIFPFLRKKEYGMKNLSTKYKHISNSLMKEVIKKILKERHTDFIKIFESTNDVYEFSDELLNPFFIIKKYKKKEGFILENELINYYKHCKDLILPSIIYRSNKEHILVFFREDYRTDFLTSLEDVYGVKEDVENIKKLKTTLTEAEFNNLHWSVRGAFESLIRLLAKIHANTPYDILEGNKKLEKNYKEELDSFCEVVNKLTNDKLNPETNQFKKDYSLIIKRLVRVRKVIYKDAYLKNALLRYRLPHKDSLDLIQIIDFEKSCLAPAQLDLVQVLDFGNFLNDKRKEDLINIYLHDFNVLVGKPWNFYNPKRIVKDKKRFKKVFDYACVHRNIMHFRSQSKLLNQGDNSPQTKLYQKLSLENSIHALNRILDYENKRWKEARIGSYWRGGTVIKPHERKILYRPLCKNESWDKKQLIRLKSYLESVYEELYQ